jgi:choline dehydrogenase-like flavoprotein
MILKNFSELIPKKDGVPRTLVVGSGATGLYAAVELSKHGHEVVLIETGGNALDNFDQSSYESIGREHEGIHLGRSKSLGGTTNLWGGQLVEFQPIDFSGREWLPDSKWPVTYEEIAPYYRPTYQNLGIPELFHSDDSVLRQVKGRTPSIRKRG